MASTPKRTRDHDRDSTNDYASDEAKRVHLETGEQVAPNAEADDLIIRLRKDIVDYKLAHMHQISVTHRDKLRLLYYMEHHKDILGFWAWDWKADQQYIDFEEAHIRRLELGTSQPIGADGEPLLKGTPRPSGSTGRPGRPRTRDLSGASNVTRASSELSSFDDGTSAVNHTHESAGQAVLSTTEAALSTQHFETLDALSSQVPSPTSGTNAAATASSTAPVAPNFAEDFAAAAAAAGVLRLKLPPAIPFDDALSMLRREEALLSSSEIRKRAFHEASVLHRVSQLKRAGIWGSKRLPKIQEPTHPKTHWDYLLNEAIWLAEDFKKERRWKLACCKKTSKSVQKHFAEKDSEQQRVQKQETQQIKRIASQIARDVRKFWQGIERVAEFKAKQRWSVQRKKILDQQLDDLVGHSEALSTKLAEGLGSALSVADTGSDAGPSSVADSRDFADGDALVEFDEDQLEQANEDDETTIAIEEASRDPVEEQAELEALRREGELPLEELLKSLPAAMFESGSEDDEDGDEDEEEAEDEEDAEDDPEDDGKARAVNQRAKEEEEEDNHEESSSVDEGEVEKQDEQAPASRTVGKRGAVIGVESPRTRGSAKDKGPAVEREDLEPVKKGRRGVAVKSSPTVMEEPVRVTRSRRATATASVAAAVQKAKMQKAFEIDEDEDDENSETGEPRMFDPDEDDEDDEETMAAEEAFNDAESHEAERAALEDEANMPIEELMAKYGLVQPATAKVSSSKAASTATAKADRRTSTRSTPVSAPVSDDDAQEEDDEDDAGDDDGDGDGGEDNDDEEDGDGGEDNDEDEDGEDVDDEDDEAGLSVLLEDQSDEANTATVGAAGTSQDLDDVAAAAAAIQPTGYTLATAAVKVAVPFLIRGGTLREYQQIGLDWLVTMHDKQLNGILADEMGLGKTIQTISLLAHLACEQNNWGPHLVIVPTSVMLNWEMEFKKWCPAFKILTYYGSPKERKAKRTGWTKQNAFHICITSYKIVVQDHSVFRRKQWHYMILDEAQNIKNFKSQRWQILLGFKAKRRLLLTGTPLQNNLMELWSLMHFLMPSVFESHNEFKEWFANPITSMIEGNEVVNEKLVKRLHKVLRPFILRRLKADVEKQMPNKYEHVVMCRLSKRQRFLYDDFMSQVSTRDTLRSGNFLSIINVLMQLRKCCNHPDMFDPRPVVSPLSMETLQYHVPSLVVDALVPEPLDNHVHLELFNLLMLQSALHEAEQFAAESLRLRLSHDEIVAAGDNMEEVQRLIAGQRLAQHDQSLAHVELLQRMADWRVSRLSHFSYLQDMLWLPQGAGVCSAELIHAVKMPLLPCESALAQDPDPFDDRCNLIRRMLKNEDERLEEMHEILDSFVFAVAPAIARGVNLVAAHCKSASLKEEKIRVLETVQQLTEVSSRRLHPVASNLLSQFPDKRLIQYDCGKLQVLDSLLRKLKAGDHRCLIFSQMTRMLDILESFLNYHGHTYLRLDGSTGIEQRMHLMNRFNRDPRIFCMILSTRSGGVGVNLTGADTVIFYDSDWNPTMDAQAQDRAHRIGQTRDVHIYRLISERTIEENILKKANQKRLLEEVTITGGTFTTDFFQSMSVKDIFGPDVTLDMTGTRGSSMISATFAAAQHRLTASVKTLSQKEIESELAKAEESEDIRAGAALRAEVAEDVVEFDESVPITAQQPETVESLDTAANEVGQQQQSQQADGSSVQVDLPVSADPAEQHIAQLETALKPVQKLAVRFLEELYQRYFEAIMAQQAAAQQAAAASTTSTAAAAAVTGAMRVLDEFGQPAPRQSRRQLERKSRREHAEPPISAMLRHDPASLLHQDRPDQALPLEAPAEGTDLQAVQRHAQQLVDDIAQSTNAAVDGTRINDHTPIAAEANEVVYDPRLLRLNSNAIVMHCFAPPAPPIGSMDLYYDRALHLQYSNTALEFADQDDHGKPPSKKRTFSTEFGDEILSLGNNHGSTTTAYRRALEIDSHVWHTDEDWLLLWAVEKHGQAWSVVSTIINGCTGLHSRHRSSLQCRERFEILRSAGATTSPQTRNLLLDMKSGSDAAPGLNDLPSGGQDLIASRMRVCDLVRNIASLREPAHPVPLSALSSRSRRPYSAPFTATFNKSVMSSSSSSSVARLQRRTPMPSDVIAAYVEKARQAAGFLNLGAGPIPPALGLPMVNNMPSSSLNANNMNSVVYPATAAAQPFVLPPIQNTTHPADDGSDPNSPKRMKKSTVETVAKRVTTPGATPKTGRIKLTLGDDGGEHHQSYPQLQQQQQPQQQQQQPQQLQLQQSQQQPHQQKVADDFAGSSVPESAKPVPANPTRPLLAQELQALIIENSKTPVPKPTSEVLKMFCISKFPRSVPLVNELMARLGVNEKERMEGLGQLIKKLNQESMSLQRQQQQQQQPPPPLPRN